VSKNENIDKKFLTGLENMIFWYYKYKKWSKICII